jgi:hypothetical protein
MRCQSPPSLPHSCGPSDQPQWYFLQAVLFLYTIGKASDSNFCPTPSSPAKHCGRVAFETPHRSSRSLQLLKPKQSPKLTVFDKKPHCLQSRIATMKLATILLFCLPMVAPKAIPNPNSEALQAIPNPTSSALQDSTMRLRQANDSSGDLVARDGWMSSAFCVRPISHAS